MYKRQGQEGTLEYRVNFHYNDNGVLKRISPWHDIPLYAQARVMFARCNGAAAARQCGTR